MPIDHKRINGPEVTIPYELFNKLNTKSPKFQFKEAVSDNGIRRDGRLQHEHRKIFLKSGVVSQAKGSAYIELHKTKVMVSVFDPREIPNKNDYSAKGELYCEFKFAPFSCQKRRLHQQDAQEQQFSAIMKEALESAVCRHEFPNFQVDIYALVLHNDGSALSAAIIAAGVALVHAGIPMYDLITSVTLAVQGNYLLLDPNLEEERLCQTALFKDEKNSNHGIIVLSILSTHEQVSQFYQTGNLTLECLNGGITILTETTKTIVDLVKKCLVKNVIKSAKDVDN